MNPCCVRAATSTFDLVAVCYVQLTLMPNRSPNVNAAIAALHAWLLEMNNTTPNKEN